MTSNSDLYTQHRELQLEKHILRKGEIKKCLACNFATDVFRKYYNYCPYCGAQLSIIKVEEK